MIDYVELRLYESATSNTYELLPSCTVLTADEKNNATDLGVVSFGYPLKDEDQVLDYINEGDVVGVAPNGKEFDRFILEDSSYQTTDDGTLVKTYNGRSRMALFEDEVVFPSAWPIPLPAGHAFYEATPGFIIQTLVARAQERGGLPWLDVSTFSGNLTSDGEAWERLQTITYPTGNTYLQVLQDLQQKGLCSVKLVGNQLRVFNPDAHVEHKLLEDFTFRLGQNVTDQSTSRDAKEVATDVLIEGEEGNAVVYKNPLQSPVGRRRTKYVQQGGITDTPTLYLIARYICEQYQDIKVEHSVGIVNASTDDPLPWQDYKIRDWVWLDNNIDPVQELQIQQMSVSLNENGEITIGLTMGTFIDDYNVRQQRKLDAITGANAGVYGSLPNTTPANASIPNPPSALAHSTDSYIFGDGIARSQVTLRWAPPATNTDGSAQTETLTYIVEYKLDADVGWRRLSPTPNSFAYISDLPQNSSLSARVYTVDAGNNYSVPSQVYTLTTARDTTPPPQPATPIVNAGSGGIQVAWSGMSIDNSSMGLDFARVEVHLSTTDQFLPDYTTYRETLYTAGSVSLNVPSSATYYVVLVAYDKSGNYSISAQASVAAYPSGGQLIAATGTWSATGAPWAAMRAVRQTTGLVTITGRSTYRGGNISINPGDTNLIGTLPVGFRPQSNEDIIGTCICANSQFPNGQALGFIITSNGSMYLFNASGAAITLVQNTSWVSPQTAFLSVPVSS